MNLIHRIVGSVAAVGFFVSLISNLSFWFGIDLLGGVWPVVFGGIFIVWFPTMLLQRGMMSRMRNRSDWKTMFYGTPAWVLPAFYVVMGYGVINFFLGFLGIVSLGGENGFWRIGSSHAMIFYGAAAGMAWGAVVRDEEGLNWKCTQGHEMAPDAKFCQECGSPLLRPDLDPARIRRGE